jgi:RNA polymerase sigma-70 factor, ECF subfamily
MDSDGRLIERIGNRDETAFAELVSRYGGRLLAVASRLLGSRADAEDAVQRALLQCFASASSYRAEWAAVSTWLYRILTNVCVDELRRRSARVGRDLKITGTPGPRDRQPGAYVDLHRALDRVPREARVLLALHYVDGLSYGELARIRGISINTVKSQLARGKSLLRAELAGRGVLS